MMRRSSSSSGNTERNVAVFNQPDVVQDYRDTTGLTLAEEMIFDRFVGSGMDVLDLGVGTGRTTPALRAHARSYVGLDYAEAMVRAARQAHPGVDYRVADARDLSAFEDASFDVVVFSFNGIDYQHPIAHRQDCLAECRRVLRPGGVLILSSHHARMTLPIMALRGLDARRKIRHLLDWLSETSRLAWRRLRCSTFWKGRGYVLDPARGGLTTYETTPAHFAIESRSAGFTLAATVPSTYPRRRPRACVPWFYFACMAVD